MATGMQSPAGGSAEGEAPFGYDVLVTLERATDLVAMDWRGTSHPYLRLMVMTPGGWHISQYTTRTMWRDLNPEFDEFVTLYNVPAGALMRVEAWDHHTWKPDDFIGGAQHVFDPHHAQAREADHPAAAAAATPAAAAEQPQQQLVQEPRAGSCVGQAGINSEPQGPAPPLGPSVALLHQASALRNSGSLYPRLASLALASGAAAPPSAVPQPQPPHPPQYPLMPLLHGSGLPPAPSSALTHPTPTVSGNGASGGSSYPWSALPHVPLLANSISLTGRAAVLGAGPPSLGQQPCHGGADVAGVEAGQAKGAGGAAPQAPERLQQLVLQLFSSKQKASGLVYAQLTYSPSAAAGQPRQGGPVRYQQSLSPFAGLLMGYISDQGNMLYCTYKVALVEVTNVFGAQVCEWNRNHPAARSVFTNPLVLSSVKTQHSTLYASSRLARPVGGMRYGVLSTPADLFSLINNGERGGERRYFTYVLLGNSLRFSETGAALMSDMMSKHAMHASAATAVTCAGEFCVVPCPSAPGGHKLAIDNNSGTYAPPASCLPLMAEVLRRNFPGLQVLEAPVGSPLLADLHAQCPSRAAA